MTALYHERALLRAGQNSSRTGCGRVQAYGTELLDRLTEAGAAEWSLVLVAPFIGSFLGLLIRRLPDGSPIARGRSRCDTCGTTLRARDLVPILSWLMAGATMPLLPAASRLVLPGGRAGRLGRRPCRCADRWRAARLARLSSRLVASRSRLDRPALLAIARCPDLAADHRRPCRRLPVQSRSADGPRSGCGARLLELDGDRGAVPSIARPRGAGRGRRQAAGRFGRLARRRPPCRR